jgi:DNA-binding response OmpR family regulator
VANASLLNSGGNFLVINKNFMAKSVLICEDEKAISKTMQLKLQKSGFEVEQAFNGEEALAILEKKDTFDIILLDLLMPKVDGFGVLEELKKRGNKIKIVVTSNLSQDEDRKRAAELGAIGYLVKADTPISKIIDYVVKNT